MRHRPKITGFVAGALFAGVALLITLVLRRVIGGSLFSSFLAPLVVLLVMELIWAAITLSRVFGSGSEAEPGSGEPPSATSPADESGPETKD